MNAWFPRRLVRGLFGVVLAAALLSTACGKGGGGTGTTTFGTGSSGNSAVLVNVGDAANASLLSFEVTVNSVQLVGSQGTVTVLNSPVRLELTRLAGTLRPLMLSNLPNATYNQMVFTFTNGQAVVLNAGVPTAVSVAVPKSAVTVTLNPNLVIASGTTSLNVDFNLTTSLTQDTSGNFTFTPQILVTANAVPTSGATAFDNGKIEDLHGTVLTVASPQFTVITQENANGITFTTDANTIFDGITGLSQLAKGMAIEVNAIAQTTGTLLAKKVEVETEGGTQGMETEGIVTQVTGSPATQLAIIANDSTSATTSLQPALGQTVTVNIATNADFRISDQVDISGLSFAPTFDASTLAPGQKIEADTDVPAVSTITAKRLKQGIQAIDGTVTALTVNGTRASFTLSLPTNSAIGALTHQTGITVFQQPSTEVKGVTVANNTSVRVRGALFFNNGTYSLIAQRIIAP